jgi:hypothetical protein
MAELKRYNYNGCNENYRKQQQWSKKEMDYNENSQHDRGKKKIQEFEEYRWTEKIQSTEESNH